MPDLPECPFRKDYFLFHVTNKDNLPSIAKVGLFPDLSDFTKQAYESVRGEELEKQGLGKDEIKRRIEQELDKLPKMVFATTREKLPLAIAMIESEELGNPLKDLAVIGINPNCGHKFEAREVVSSIDVVSKERVNPGCLCIIPRKEWLKEYRDALEGK